MGMQPLFNVGSKKEFSHQVVKTTRQNVNSPDFQQRHKVRPEDFTRNRALSFGCVVVLLLQKTVRSIQLHLQAFFQELDGMIQTVTNSAWTQSRAKLKHTAFIELNQVAILDPVYAPGSAFEPLRWQGQHRLLAVDSSLLRLPNQEEIGRAFGWVECENQKGSCGRYAQGRLSVLTDVLNRIGVQALLVNWREGERSLVCEHIKAMEQSDVALLDRGYAAYELFAQFIQAGCYFVCRCPTSSFAAANELFAADQAGRSVIVELRPPNGAVETVRAGNLPERIRVRFLSVRLKTGELEVLATNLLDEGKYPTDLFLELYGYRWGIETYYGLLKGRLDLENFSGRTVESVFQDVHATIFLSNFESVITRESSQQLKADSVEHKHPKEVNRAVSFHAIKSRIIDLLLSNKPVEEVLPQIQELFMQNAVSIRTRDVPRKKPSAWRFYQHRRTERKIVF